jgi:hypothetical protein
MTSRFTLDAADRALVLVRPVADDVRRHYVRLRRDLAALNQLDALDELSADDSIPPVIRAQLGELQACLRELQELGATVVDPELGLVSLDGRLPGIGDVHFCWKLGEDRVRFWYPLGGRYDDRRPVPASIRV